MYFLKHLSVSPEVGSFYFDFKCYFNDYLFLPCQRTPLHIAVEEDKIDTVECLVNKRADINIEDNGGVSIFVRL